MLVLKFETLVEISTLKMCGWFMKAKLKKVDWRGSLAFLGGDVPSNCGIVPKSVIPADSLIATR